MILLLSKALFVTEVAGAGAAEAGADGFLLGGLGVLLFFPEAYTRLGVSSLHACSERHTPTLADFKCRSESS